MTVLDAIYSWRAKRPDAVAIIDHDTPVTYSEFAQAIDVTRNILSSGKFELPPQGVVAIMSSGFPMWCIQFALRSMGLDTVFVPNLTAAAALRFKNLVAVVTTRRDIELRGKGSQIRFSCKLITLQDAFWKIPIAPSPDKIDERPHPFGNHFLYTSGTTGEYKKVMVNPRLERLVAERAAELGEVPKGTISHILNFGAHTAAGYRFPINCWVNGTAIIIDERSDALANLVRHSPTKVTLTPDLASILAKNPPEIRPDISPPEISLGGGFASYQLVQSLWRAGFNRIRNFYGSTEQANVLYSYIDNEDTLTWLKAFPGRHFEIIDAHGDVCKIGQEGTLRIKLLEQDASGYFDDPEATAAFFSDGWFYPGDLAVRREDGRIRILGRAGDVINLMGAKRATAPFEQAIERITAASAVCIFQQANLDGTDQIVVVLEAEHGPPPEEADRVRALFPDQTDMRIEVLPQFPRTTLGMNKIQRLELRKLVFG